MAQILSGGNHRGGACPETRVVPVGLHGISSRLLRTGAGIAKKDTMEWETLLQLQQSSCRLHAAQPLFGVKGNAKAPAETGSSHDVAYSWVSYGEFDRQVCDGRAALAARGVMRGDKVAIISRNRLEWAVTAYACYGLGAQPVPMYEQQSPHEWEFILRDSGAVLACVATEQVVRSVLPLVDSAKCPDLREVLCFDRPAGQELSFAAALSSGKDRSVPPIDNLRPEELATLIYTSGTTGEPKGVMLSHANIVSNVKAMRGIMGHRLGPSSRSLSFLPWAHVYGQTVELHALLSAGASMGLAEAPTTILQDIQVVRPTVLIAVPTVYNKIYDAVKLKVSRSSRLKGAFFHAAMKVAKERRKWFDEGQQGWNPSLWLRWQLSRRFVLSSVTDMLGGNLKMAFTGGAALSPAVQQWFDDIGIPVSRHSETSLLHLSWRTPFPSRCSHRRAGVGGIRAHGDVTVHCLGALWAHRADSGRTARSGGRCGFHLHPWRRSRRHCSRSRGRGRDMCRYCCRFVLMFFGAGLEFAVQIVISFPRRPDIPSFYPNLLFNPLYSNSRPYPFPSTLEFWQVMGPNVMVGYHGRPEKTAEVFCDVGGESPAFRTGDLGRLSADGVLTITGRVKEQYKLENGKFVVPGPVEDTLRLESLYVSQSFVYGANRPHNVMLVVPDFPACAEELGLSGAAAEPEVMVSSAKLRALIQSEIDGVAPLLKSYCVPRNFALLTDPFTVENGLLTPKMSMKRPAITKVYQDLLDSLY